jgi:hypothetical protein
MVHAPPSGSKGGLLLAWCHGVDVEYFSVSVNKINAWCYSDPPNSPWLLSCIYGPLEKQYDYVFWDSLLDEGLCNTPSPLRLGLSLFFFYNKIFAKIHKVYQST